MHFTKSNIQVVFLHVPTPHLISSHFRKRGSTYSDRFVKVSLNSAKATDPLSRPIEVSASLFCYNNVKSIGSVFLYTLFVTRCPFITRGRRSSERLPCLVFLSVTLYIGKIIGSTSIDRFESRRHSKSGDGPTRASSF